mgnify:CR=1 FL=1
MNEEKKKFLKRLRYCLQIGLLDRQQTKTLRGQVKAGDLEGAIKGLDRIIMGKETEE